MKILVVSDVVISLNISNRVLFDSDKLIVEMLKFRFEFYMLSKSLVKG